MVAAPFTQVVILKGVKTGRAIHQSMSLSDVDSEFGTLQDGTNFIQLPSNENFAIMDIIVTTGGTDTKFQDLFVNNLAIGVRITNTANLNSSYNRQFQSAPVTIQGGSIVKFKQETA